MKKETLFKGMRIHSDIKGLEDKIQDLEILKAKNVGIDLGTEGAYISFHNEKAKTILGIAIYELNKELESLERELEKLK